MKKFLPLIALAALGLSAALTGCSKPADDAAATPAADSKTATTPPATTPPADAKK